MKGIKFGSARDTFRIAGPVMVENFSASMIMMINTAMVGSLGRLAAATVGVNASPMWLLNSIPMGLCVGSTVMVARFIGAREPEKASNVANQTVGGIFVLSLIISLLLFFVMADRVPALLNADPIIMDSAVQYLRILSLSIVPNFIGFACSAMLRGSGNTKTPMFAGLMTNIIIVSLNFMLIFEPLDINIGQIAFTIPRAGLGVYGAAISTVIAQTVFGTFLLSKLCGGKQKIKVDLRRIFKLNWETLRPVIKVGLPALGERLIISFGQTMYQSTVNALGAAASSAHYIALQIESMAFMPANAIGIAATTLVGQNLGAKNKEAAQGYANTTLLFGFCLGLFCFIMLFFLPGPLMSLFIPDAEIISSGASVLRIIAPVEPFFCMLIVINGILRGGGDTRFALIAGLAGMWGIRLGSAYIFVNILQLGLPGAWIAMAADIFTRFAIMFFRYRRKKWLYTGEI